MGRFQEPSNALKSIKAIEMTSLSSRSATKAFYFASLSGILFLKRWTTRPSIHPSPFQVEVNAPVLYDSCRGYSRVVTDEEEVGGGRGPSSHTSSAHHPPTTHTPVNPKEQQQQVAPDTAGSEQQMPPALDGPPTVDPPFADRLCAEAGAQAATVPLGIPSGLRDAVEAEGGARPCNGASARTVAGANELAGAQLVEVRVGEE